MTGRVGAIESDGFHGTLISGEKKKKKERKEKLSRSKWYNYFYRSTSRTLLESAESL